MSAKSRQSKCLQIDIINNYKPGFSYAVWLEARGPEMSFKLFESIISDKSLMSQYNDEYEAEVTTESNQKQPDSNNVNKTKKHRTRNNNMNNAQEKLNTVRYKPTSKVISSGARLCEECGRYHRGNVCY